MYVIVLRLFQTRDRAYQSEITHNFVVGLRCLISRENEDAYVSVNGNVCWIKNGLRGTDGTQLCGGWFKEESFRVTGCYITLSAPLGATVPLTVRVWTNLDGDADDESFGIDNVLVTKLEEGYLGL